MKAIKQNKIAASSLKMNIALYGITAMIGSAFVINGGAVGAVSANQTAAQQTRLQTIISKGDQEISRRLTSLATLTSKINAATKLSASDKTSLTSEVGSTVSGLDTLKAKLDAETTLVSARADAQDIYTQYRVYALVTPKVHLVKFADGIQVADGKLTTLAQKLQSRIDTDKQAGKDVSALQTKLDDMTSKTAAAQISASQVGSGIINLQPSDYDSNHAVLSGDNSKLQAARTNNQGAYADAKSIITSLKSL